MRNPGSIVLLLCLIWPDSNSAKAQIASGPRIAGPVRITGVVRIAGRPAPEGILVLLDVAPSRDQVVTGVGEVDRTLTDSSGRFTFQHLEAARRGSTKLFAVTVRYPGYKESFQIVDLTLATHGYVNLELHRDTSRDPVNVPPEGAGATISAKQAANPEAQQAFEKGKALLLEKHDPKASVDDFKRAIKLDPKWAPAYACLGTAYIQLHSFRDAQSAFEKAIKLQPADADSYLGLAVALNAQQDFSSAEKALLHSLELNPKSAAAEYEMAKSFWGQGNWQQAEPHARKAIEIDRNFPMSHIVMGNIYLRHRDAGSALKEFEEYLRLDPEGLESTAVKEMVTKIQNAMAQR